MDDSPVEMPPVLPHLAQYAQHMFWIRLGDMVVGHLQDVEAIVSHEPGARAEGRKAAATFALTLGVRLPQSK